jgi:hypothetical protein
VSEVEERPPGRQTRRIGCATEDVETGDMGLAGSVDERSVRPLEDAALEDRPVERARRGCLCGARHRLRELLREEVARKAPAAAMPPTTVRN